MMTDLISELRAKAEAAVPGTWRAKRLGEGATVGTNKDANDGINAAWDIFDEDDGAATGADADHIAA